MDYEKTSSERAGQNGAVEAAHTKEKSTHGSGQGTARHHGFAKGNLSIIVPGSDETQDGDEKSLSHSNVLTLPGIASLTGELLIFSLGAGILKIRAELFFEAV
jgi:hypothetical protein